jgi:hypothetical protein
MITQCRLHKPPSLQDALLGEMEGICIICWLSRTTFYVSMSSSMEFCLSNCSFGSVLHIEIFLSSLSVFISTIFF